MFVNKLGIKKSGTSSKTFMSNLLVVDTVIDPASLATVTGAVTTAITVPGAALGDRVEVFPPYDMQGIMAYGHVSAANAVKVSFFNPTAGTINLASGTWTIHVIRK